MGGFRSKWLNYNGIMDVRVKARLHDLLRKDEEFDTEEIEQVTTKTHR